MPRFAFALLLAALSSLITLHADGPRADAQEKKKKDKKGTVPEPTGEIKEDLSRVLPVFDPGAHTRAICALGFTKDKSKLITVGEDFTVQVWSTATGERLDILRLPGYGREKGYDPGRWNVAAVSPDGCRVALGGEMKYLSSDGDDNAARLLLIDVVKRSFVRVQLRTGRNRPVSSLRFAPSGNTLAVGIEKGPKEEPVLMLIDDLDTRVKNARPGVKTEDCKQKSLPTTPSTLEFSPDGKLLLTGGVGARNVCLWDVGDGTAPGITLVKEITVEGETRSLAWSPEGKQFARAADGTTQSGLRAIELWNADGTKAKTWKAADMAAVFSRRPGKIYTVKFLDAKTVYFVANGPGPDGKNDGGASLSGTIDITTGKDKRLVAFADGLLKATVGASTADGSLVAVTVAGNTEVLVGPPTPGAPQVRCGIENQLPHHVGWSKDVTKPCFAWTDERHIGKAAPTSDTLQFGFDLSKIEPLGAINTAGYVPSLRRIGGWSLEHDRKKGEKDDSENGSAQLMHDGKLHKRFPIPGGIGQTLIPNGEKPPHVAFATHTEMGGETVSIHGAGGDLVARLLPHATRIRDMAASPDGRFLIATTGTPRLVIYRTDGSPYPLMSFAQLNGEWVIWTPEGYYAASPGGEKLFGWAVSNQRNELVSFYPAEQYSKQFHRPDIIKLAIEKGSVKEALVSLRTVTPEIEKILPPSAKLELVEQRGAKVKVKASASSGVKDKAITAMRVLLDGRPLPAGKGVWAPAPGKPAEETFEVEVPPGLHELKVLARSDEGSTVSDPLTVRGPKIPGSQPTIYRICVGVNDYDDAGLKLGSAAKDAEAMFAALEKNCVGSDNRFGAARGELILNKDATRDRVVKVLADARKSAKPGDLVVIFFAGHGVKQGDSYFLLTREADPTKDLAGKSLSGDDLRKGLSEVECPVLLLLDACHSAAGVKAFRPATDDLTRSLTDDTVGVTVMSAAMAHETAGATGENGFFTAGLLKGLRAGEGVPFDPYERQLYVHHLYAVAFSEVRKATNGKQNPFLNMPWTVPPLPIRDVAGK